MSPLDRNVDLILADDLKGPSHAVVNGGGGAGRGVRLRVGYAPSLASGILSVAVENFTQAHPDAKVELFDLSTGEMLAELESNKLDIILTVASDTKTRGLKWTPLVRTTWKLAVNRKHPFVSRQRITPGQMARESLLAFCQRDYPEYWDIIIDWMKEHWQRPKIDGEYDGGESLMTAVESGLGVAVVTDRTAQLFRNRAHFKILWPDPPPPSSGECRSHRSEPRSEAAGRQKLCGRC